MKKNYFLRAAAVLLVCGMFSLCTIPRTLSKYSGDFTASSTKVRAGIFEVAVQKGDGSWVSITRGSTGLPFPLDLYEITKLLQTSGATHNANVLQPPPAGSPVLIAPGTAGRFVIKVKNFSEVKVVVSIEDDDPIITGGFDMSDKIEWWDPDKGLVGEFGPDFPGVPSGATAILDPLGTTGSTQTYTFTWRWMYQRGGSAWSAEDRDDTELGYDGAVTYSIPLIVTTAQLD